MACGGESFKGHGVRASVSKVQSIAWRGEFWSAELASRWENNNNKKTKNENKQQQKLRRESDRDRYIDPLATTKGKWTALRRAECG